MAFTRAVDALYVMTPRLPQSSGSGASAGSLISEALKSLPGDFTRVETEASEYIECGELPAVEREVHGDQLVMRQYIVSEPRGSLRLERAAPAARMS